MAEFVEKIMGLVAEILWLTFSRVAKAVSGRIELTLPNSYGPSISFLENTCDCSNRFFYLGKSPRSFFFVGFNSNFQEFYELNF